MLVYILHISHFITHSTGPVLFHYQYRGKRLCDNYYDTITVKKGSKLSIRFHSDYAENGKGFKAHIFREQREGKPDSLHNVYGIITEPHCTLNNGGCAHICVPFGTTRKCQCTAGYKLLDDGVSCGG